MGDAIYVLFDPPGEESPKLRLLDADHNEVAALFLREDVTLDQYAVHYGLLSTTQQARDMVWQGREADEVEDVDLAMVTREAWQLASEAIRNLFAQPGGE